MSSVVDVKTKPEVGDILVSLWGYDQTNVDFYKVTKTTDKSVWLKPIKQKVVHSSEGGITLSENVVPVDEPVFTNQWNEKIGNFEYREAEASRYKIHYRGERGYRVRLSSFQSASAWNGKPQNQTHYH